MVPYEPRKKLEENSSRGKKFDFFGDSLPQAPEEDTEEEQQEGDQEDQGELLLQVGQPAGLATIFNFIQPVGRASSLSCSGHRGYKLCSLDDRRKTRMSCGFFAVPVKIK